MALRNRYLTGLEKLEFAGSQVTAAGLIDDHYGIRMFRQLDLVF